MRLHNPNANHNLLHTHAANINDRSMVGDGDSELAVVLDNKQFSQGLRCQLTK